MARKPKPLAPQIVQSFKDLLRDADRLDNLALTHRIAVSSSDGDTPIMFTVEIARGRAGRLVAICREFPGLLFSGASEDEVLLRAELAIRQRLRTSF